MSKMETTTAHTKKSSVNSRDRRIGNSMRECVAVACVFEPCRDWTKKSYCEKRRRTTQEKREEAKKR